MPKDLKRSPVLDPWVEILRASTAGQPQGSFSSVQSFAGGAATVTYVSNDGAFSKSNISSSAFAYWSCFVNCCVTPFKVRNLRSISASSDV